MNSLLKDYENCAAMSFLESRIKEYNLFDAVGIDYKESIDACSVKISSWMCDIYRIYMP